MSAFAAMATGLRHNSGTFPGWASSDLGIEIPQIRGASRELGQDFLSPSLAFQMGFDFHEF